MKILHLTLLSACVLFSTIGAHNCQGSQCRSFPAKRSGPLCQLWHRLLQELCRPLDAQLFPVFGRRLADRVKVLNKEMRVIYITHGHIDHWFGLEELVKAFPKSKSQGRSSRGCSDRLGFGRTQEGDSPKALQQGHL